MHSRSALAALALLLTPQIARADYTLVDPQTFDWEIDSIGDGSIFDGGHGTSGRADAYDAYGKLCINPSTSFSAAFPVDCATSGNVLYTATTESLNAASNEVTMGAATVMVGTTSVSVQRRVYVPSTGTVGFLRYLDSFTNPGTAPVTFRVSIGALSGSSATSNGTLGSDANTIIRSTSSGDATLTTADTWVTTDDSNATSGDPSLGFVWWGAGAAAPPSQYTFATTGGGQLTSSYLITVPAGGTVRLMTFLAQRLNDAAAATSTGNLAALSVSSQLTGLSDTELTEIINWEFDADGDGASIYTDCDDGDASASPGAVEVCDGIDNDCDGEVDEDDAADAVSWFADDDEDGFGGAPGASCEPPVGAVFNGDDCDDADGAVNPDATEVCDEADNDCDGATDEAGALGEATYYTDGDEDGFGDTAFLSCFAPLGAAEVGGDCDDGDNTINPGAEEACDGLDNDCDGSADEAGALGETTYYTDGDGDSYGLASSAAQSCLVPPGAVTRAGDCDDGSPAVNPSAAEICNLVDDDCDGTIDGPTSTDLTTFFVDNDRDGYGGSSTAQECFPRSGLSLTGGDCDDSRLEVSPAAAERCATAYDDDCDGSINEPSATDARTFYADADTDGYGALGVTTLACTAPSGYVSDATDCDDGRAASNPGATELCNGFDDDCDTVTDEPDAVDARLWYRDSDGDTYGTSGSGLLDVRRECAQPSGYEDENTDCNDGLASINPGAAEVCDGVDQDCDGSVDEDATDALTTYADADSDGAGDPTVSRRECAASPGYVTAGTDCDDTRAYVAPGMPELCDGLDDDCDGALSAAELDDDTDGYVECLPDAVGWQGGATLFGDCDDARADVNPAGAEVEYDGVDQDCDGGDLCDLDEDGFDAEACGGLDCDDLDEAVHPDATERFYDGVDDNCDPADDDDFDGDGVPSASYGGTDCDDARADVYPGAPDAYYDGVVTDCSPEDEHDADGDGFATTASGGSDCDDSNSAANPEAEEVWYDGLDQDCDGNDADQDRDGVAAPEDCADTDPAVYPNAPGYDADCNPLTDGSDGGDDGSDGGDGGDGDVEVDTGGLAAGPEGNFVGGSGKPGCASTAAPRAGLLGLLAGALALVGLRRRR